ncbi:MAG: phosphopantetheine-binding protein [Candidatus Competibacteraceae bacterium]|nr:phosphopantetheine-binding protein [Candidatus Competibacteraceae bacterium]
MSTCDRVKILVGEVLQLGDRARDFDRSTPLLGSIPEFDSMVVISLITALEEQFGIFVEDDEISAETFETVGNLCDFVEQKLTG